MSKVWEPNKWYSLLRPYVDWCTRTSFSKLEVKGKENIPSDSIVILGPNHCNTLMDALLVLQSDKRRAAFGARADIFKNKTAASILRFLRILPVFRKRDGLAAVAQNQLIFEEMIDCMDHDVPMCIFSEGTHRAKHSLLPVKKGIFRIAKLALDEIEGKKTYVVPVGLDYEDFFHYMKRAKVTFGEPIEVHSEDDLGELTNVLHDKLSKLITFFPDDENYDRNWAEYEAKHRPRFHWWKLPAAVLLLPVFLIAGIISCPIWITAEILGSRMEDKAWLNTVRLCCKLVGVPVLTILALVLGIIFLPWYLIILLIVAVWYSQPVFYYIFNFYSDLLK